MPRTIAGALLAVLIAACGTMPQSPSSAPATATQRAAADSAAPVPSAAAATASGSPAEPTLRPLTAAVGAAAIRTHLEALQRIADEHGGNRASGMPGFEASVEYVAASLTESGYRVDREEFAYEGGSSVNLVAELAGRDGSRVVMAGAHLDSVREGPGINDNGTGVGTLLVVASELAARVPPPHTVRFAFWGAEEPGRHGSQAYVASLSASERERIAAYLNLEMLGSPNHIRFVHADSSAAPGSEAITARFAEHFEGAGLAWEPIDLGGKSDHAAFTDAGIPTGGLFGGGIEPKTQEQAERFGGVAGDPADPCSHAACDTLANIDDAALDEFADALVHVLIELAGTAEPGT